jgi:hypothetical protein
MFNALLYYVINASPEIPRLSKRLDEVVRQMVKHKPSDKLKFDVDSILPDIQRFFDGRDDLVGLSSFKPVDLSVYQMNPLELFSETPPLNGTNRIQDLQMDDTESEEEGPRALASKRPRLSL